MKSLPGPRTIEALEKEISILYEEVLVGREASAISARLVTKQFRKLEEILRQLEENAAESKSKEREISHLFQMVQTVNSTLDFDTVARSVMDALKGIFEFDAMAILLIDEVFQQLSIYRIYGDGLSEETLSKYYAIKISKNEDHINTYILSKDEPVYVTGLSNATKMSPADKRFWEMNPFVSGLFLQLKVQSKVIGTINFFRMKEDLILTQNDIRKIEYYISHLATAINNARLSEETRKALDNTRSKELQISHLNQVLQTVNSTLDLDKVIAAVTIGLQEIFAFDQIGIMLTNEQKNQMSFIKAYGKGLTDEQVEKIKTIIFPIERATSILSNTVIKNKSYYIPKITEESVDLFLPLDRQIWEVTRSRAYLFYPLEFQQKVIGAIAFGDSRNFFE